MVGSSPWTMDGAERAPVTITRHGDDHKLIFFLKKAKVLALDTHTSCTKITGRGSAFLGLRIRRPQSRSIFQVETFLQSVQTVRTEPGDSGQGHWDSRALLAGPMHAPGAHSVTNWKKLCDLCVWWLPIDPGDGTEFSLLGPRPVSLCRSGCLDHLTFLSFFFLSVSLFPPYFIDRYIIRQLSCCILLGRFNCWGQMNKACIIESMG